MPEPAITNLGHSVALEFDSPEGRKIINPGWFYQIEKLVEDHQSRIASLESSVTHLQIEVASLQQKLSARDAD